MASLAEELSLNFYLWERRGRGWDVWDYPVSIEPPFVPFYSHSSRALVAETVHDDGRIPTPLSEFAESVKKFLKGPNGSSESLMLPDSFEEPMPVMFHDDSGIKEIQLSVPADRKIALEYAEDLLLNLASGSGILSFELFGREEKIVSRFACRERDLPYVLQQLKAYFPDAWYEVQNNSLRGLPDDRKYTTIVDFGLSEEFMRPLQDCRGFEPDPLTGLIGAMDCLHDGETGLVQVLFRPVEHPWAESMIRSVTSYDGDSFFVDSPEMLPLTREKVSSPLVASIVRVMAQSKSEKRSWEIARSIGGALTVLARSSSNELIPLNNDGYADNIHLEDVIQRQSRRSGMILNSRELLNFVHIPSLSVRSKKFRGHPRKTKSAPRTVEGHAFVLGENVHQNRVTQVTLSTEQRLRHIHIIGSTGTGKSTLLLNLVAQDMKAGSGCAVFDPHGDLIDRLVELVPEERIQDVILFDPSDTEYPIGFNILEAHTEIEKTVLSSDMVALFRRFSTSWGDQMTAVLGNAVSAFLENPEGGTLLELRRFLIEDNYRISSQR